MKFLMFFMSLSVLVSCNGGKSEKTAQEKNDKALSPYSAPVIGHQRSITLNYRQESSYEHLTFNPNPNTEVLGEKPFFLFLDSDNAFRLSPLAASAERKRRRGSAHRMTLSLAWRAAIVSVAIFVLFKIVVVGVVVVTAVAIGLALIVPIAIVGVVVAIPILLISAIA